jgi:twitching motility protein PilT
MDESILSARRRCGGTATVLSSGDGIFDREIGVELPFNVDGAHLPFCTFVRRLMVEPGVTDIHLAEKKEVWFRLGGIMNSSGIRVPSNGLQTLGAEVLGSPAWNRRNSSCTYGSRRLRLRYTSTMGRKQLFIRILPGIAPSLSVLGYGTLFDSLLEGELPPGLFLVAGPTGSGKSTLLAALIQQFLDTRPVHVLTIEDPIEYVYCDALGEASQRQIIDDTGGDPDFSSAVSGMLREDPDIVLIGEMRDSRTAEAALIASETGHLVFGTIHAPSVPGIVDRFLGMLRDLPDAKLRLSQSLLCGVALTVRPPDNEGGKITRVCEIAWNDNDVIRTAIRNGKTYEIGERVARHET